MSTTSSSSSSASDFYSVPARGSPSPLGRGYRGRGKGRAASLARGRGQGRGKGRARGRGRGQSGALGQNRADEALHILETRKERFKNALQEMSVDRMRDLLVEAMEKSPSLILDVFEPPRMQPGGFHPPAGQEAPEWCICSHCREMPTQAERLCCGMMPEYCISLMPDFRVLILDEAVLALQRMYRRDILVFDDEADLNKANRHAAYRQFVLWQHGRLTIGDRRVIPSCSVWKIRDKYPDAFGQYTGFVPSRLV